MPIYVQVGADVVEFPDGMTDAQIAQAISGQTAAPAPRRTEEVGEFLAGMGKQQGFPYTPSSGFLMGLKDPISGGAQMLPRALAGITSLGGTAPNPVSRFFSDEARRVDEMVRAEEQAYQAQREPGFDAARLAGNILNPASIVPATRAAQLARARGLGTTAQAATAGVVGGVTQPVVSGEDFAGQKAEQVVLGGVMGPVGEKVVAGAGRALNPLVSKAEQTMRDLGIRPTTGQTLGGQFKAMEEFAQNLPLIGSSIENARQRTLFNFNKAVIDKALKKVDEKLPADVIGRDAVAYASDQVSKQYDDVLAKMSFDLDFATTSNILNALSTAKNLSPAQRQEIATTLNDTVLQKFAGQKLDGKTYKGIESDLRKKASNYMNSALASEREVGEALSGVLGVLKKELYAQNPKQTSKLRRVDSAFSDLSVINVAAANSGAESGVFTPKQYSTAVRQQDQTRRKTAFAKGRAKGQEESDAAVAVLGDTARSTLEGRIAASAVGGLGMLSQPQFAIPAAVAVPALYSPGGQAMLDAILRSRPELARQIGGMLSQGAAPLGGVIAPSAVGQYNLSERQ
jgi:hypothetical protein